MCVNEEVGKNPDAPDGVTSQARLSGGPLFGFFACHRPGSVGRRWGFALLRKQTLTIIDMLLGIRLAGFADPLGDPQVFLKTRDGVFVAVILFEAASLVEEERFVVGGNVKFR